MARPAGRPASIAVASVRSTKLLTASLAVAVVASVLLAASPALAAPPANDELTGATVVDPLPFAMVQDTTEATPAVDDPSCSFGAEATVWYSFTPSENQRVTADTFGSDYDTVLSAYTGTSGALSQVACNDDAGNGLQSRVRFDVAAGTTYYFMIAAYDLGGLLDFSVQRERLPTSLGLSTSKSRVYRGEAVRVVAHLAAQDATNKEVSIFATPQGGRRRLVAAGNVDSSGDFAVSVTLGKTTKFVAEWAGDDAYLPATSKRSTVYFGVKNGTWFGSTRQGWPVDFRVKGGTKLIRLSVSYVVKWDNCGGRAFVELKLRFRRPVEIGNDRFQIRWNIRPIRGVMKGTFSSRSRIKGKLSSSIDDRSIGCSGDLKRLRWNATHF